MQGAINDGPATLMRGCWALVRLGVMLALSMLCLSVSHAQGGQRVALVIGNAAYHGQKPLRNPGNDAADMAAALGRAGFKTTSMTDLGRVAMNRAIDRFLADAEGADLAVVYYSGHGMQLAGETYLIPVDARIDSERDMRSEALRLGELMDDLEARRIRHTLLILDACRDNPFRTRLKGGSKGLAPPKEMSSAFMVAYATADGRTADDGEGRNGTYTTELLRQLKQSAGKSVRDLLEDTQLAVEKASEGRQRPKTYGDTAKFRDLYLAGARVESAPLPSQPQPQPAPSSAPSSLALKLAPGQVVKDCDVCPEVVVIPAGRFMMGSPLTEKDREIDEGPQHAVAIGSMAVGRTEVTFRQWDACVAAMGCTHRPADEGWGRGERPVINVSWVDAQQYVGWLSAKTGRTYRLLSEAEWEYAARATTLTPFHTGQTITSLQANFQPTSPGARGAAGQARGSTVEVGHYSPNAFGLFDMHGNVWEWVQDCYEASAYAMPGRSDGSAHVAGTCTYRGLRGGSWSMQSRHLRSAFRGWDRPDQRTSFVGLRVARTID